jgi:hypothetical protein
MISRESLAIVVRDLAHKGSDNGSKRSIGYSNKAKGRK